jgi:tetratricopeptide (TPR) repeat protein
MKISLLLTLLGSSIAIASYNSPVLALSPIEVQKIARQSTVRIAGCTRAAGVIIRKDNNAYTVLTSALGANQAGCEIVAPDGHKYPVTVVKTFTNSVDLSAISFTSNSNYPVAKQIDNSDRIEAGEAIYITEITSTLSNNNPVLSTIRGDIIANSTQQLSNGYSLIYTSNSLPARGGPIWNSRGETIGIHGRRSVARIGTKSRVLTGANLGVTTNTFSRFATLAGIKGYAPVVLAPKLKPVDDAIASAIEKEGNGDYRGMYAQLNDAVFLDSQNPYLYYLRGVAKTILNNADAIADYNFAQSLNFNTAVLYGNRGAAKLNAGDKKGAIVDLDRSIALAANEPQFYYHRANAKRGAAALADYNKSLALDPQIAPAYFRRAAVKAALKDAKGQLADLNRAIEVDANYLAAYYTRALVKVAAKDNRGAIVDFDRVIALDPQPAKPYRDRASAKLATGDNRGALADYDRAIAIDNNYAPAYVSRGAVKAKLDDTKGAIADFQQAANRYKLQRQNASYNRVLAEIARLNKKTQTTQKPASK